MRSSRARPRADAFANVAGAGATPGTLRYLGALRDQLLPFQEWLLEMGPLSDLYGEYISRRQGEVARIAGYLSGRAHTYSEKDGKRSSDTEATPAERLALLQDAAASYSKVARCWACRSTCA